MKKMFFLIVIIFVIYFCIQIGFNYFGPGHFIMYTLNSNGTEIKVEEKSITNSKLDRDSYIINIDANNIDYNLTIYDDFHKATKIIDNVEYYKDDKYACIFILYKDKKIINDILCNDGLVNIPYYNIENPTDGLNLFVDKMKKNYGYRLSMFKENIEEDQDSYYRENIPTGHFIGLVTNGSMHRYNKIESFGKSVLSSLTNYIYPIQDKITYLDKTNNILYYNSITSSKNGKINLTKEMINLQYLGSVGDSLYFYDKVSLKEFEINLNSNNILEVGSVNTSIKYYDNGVWKHSDITKINLDEINFDKETSDYNDAKYDQIVKKGYESGYYYFYEKDGNEYKVYRANLNDKLSKTYIFRTDNPNNIKYLDDYIYYISDNRIMYYNESTGTRTIAIYSYDISNVKFQVYIDKTKITK